MTKTIEWEKTRIWLDAVARSGTALIISPEPDAVGAQQREVLREAFAIAAASPAAIADDTLLTNTPQHWTSQCSDGAKRRTYTWEEDGASPFSI